MENSFQLTLWQKKQASLLYHFASLDYLKGLQQRVHDLVRYIDATLDRATAEQRDTFLVDKQWGNRNTATNWANNAWPYLADLQLDLAKDIANRAFEIYSVTGTNNCGRGMSEYSMQWTTPAEQEKFDAMFGSLSVYAMYIDDTMKKNEHVSRWDDFSFALAWQEFKAGFRRLPKFNVRQDVEGETDKVPGRTGVYVPQDDPHGALQFAWTGGDGGRLSECPTFTQIGLDALNAVGRRELWLNDQKMYDFATTAKYVKLFREKLTFNSSPKINLAASAVGDEAFTSRPCKWYYVEVVNGEFEDIDDSLIPGAIDRRVRVEGGHFCPEPGYYFTPARQDSRRYFKQGEIMPDVGNAVWKTIWQWDQHQ